MSIWETVKAALDTLAPIPNSANVYIGATPGELPDQFLVHQLISDPPVQHADDDETMRACHVQVTFYSRTGLATVPAQVEAAMKAAGFTRRGSRELPYNPATKHFGLALEFELIVEEP